MSGARKLIATTSRFPIQKDKGLDLSIWPFFSPALCLVCLRLPERDVVEQLRTITRLLHISDQAPATIQDAGFGDLGQVDGIVLAGIVTVGAAVRSGEGAWRQRDGMGRQRQRHHSERLWPPEFFGSRHDQSQRHHDRWCPGHPRTKSGRNGRAALGRRRPAIGFRPRPCAARRRVLFAGQLPGRAGAYLHPFCPQDEDRPRCQPVRSPVSQHI